MRIVIFGADGFCGRLLVPYFVAAGHEVIVVTRRANSLPGVIAWRWDGQTLGEWTLALEGADAVINLAGRSVNCRYTPAHCAEIYASRLDSTWILGEAIAACVTPPRVWLNASSATIYRHAQDRPMDEETGEIGAGFSVDVCRRWERELFRAPTPETRRVALRSAMVFAPQAGGVWDAFAGLARWGLAGPMAGGRHYVSWIHGEDFCRAVAWILAREELAGPVNLAAPNPLPNHDFLSALRRAIGQPIGLPSARWTLEVGAWLRHTEAELLLKSRRVVPGKLLASGFTFCYPTWPDAARALHTLSKAL
ncbi:MAG TPA: TIGR01777 family oxidoreductase [Chthonomonadaceae bacterium]|nr:TIGR01777 family oxidoreductase [Chthonomonadaceae bacterium]